MIDHLPDTNVGNVEYISREDAVNAVPEELKVDFMDEFGAGFNSCRNEMLRTVEALPPADVAPVRHGRWIHDGHHRRCDKCGAYFCNTDREGDTIPDNFCPNCGAKMDREE